MTEPKSIEEIKQLIRKENLGPDQESYNKKLIVEGFDTIKHRTEYNNQLKEANNISIDVQNVSGWIHNLVRDLLGGSVNSQKQVIEWHINNKTIEFNPYSGTVSYVE